MMHYPIHRHFPGTSYSLEGFLSDANKQQSKDEQRFDRVAILENFTDTSKATEPNCQWIEDSIEATRWPSMAEVNWQEHQLHLSRYRAQPFALTREPESRSEIWRHLEGAAQWNQALQLAATTSFGRHRVDAWLN